MTLPFGLALTSVQVQIDGGVTYPAATFRADRKGHTARVDVDGVTVASIEQVTNIEVMNRKTWRVFGANGELWVIAKDDCGCGGRGRARR